MASTTFNPSKSNVSIGTMEKFIGDEVTDDVKEVPGVGPAAEKALAAAGVDTTYQLIGKYLSLKSKGISVQAHCDAFASWLKEIGINAFRNGIVAAVANKCNGWMFGIYDSGALEGAEAAEEVDY